MTTNAEAIVAARTEDLACHVCGARLDETHLELVRNEYTCSFCGAKQTQQLLGGLGRDGWAPNGGGPPDVGEALRAAREERGLALTKAAEATRIHKRYLQALEDGEPLDRFPGRVYARFFLRDYAEYLDLEPGPLVRSFDEAAAAEPLKPMQEPVMTPPGRRGWRVSAALSVVALIAIAVDSRVGGSPAGSAVVSVVGAPAAGSSPTPAPSVINVARAPRAAPTVVGIHAVLRIIERCWVEATKDGRLTLAETLKPGRTVRLRANRMLDLTLGNAAGTSLTVNGRRITTGGQGAVVQLSFSWRHGELLQTRE
jgi:transcriptional regulator with XRE-family HTH domain